MERETAKSHANNCIKLSLELIVIYEQNIIQPGKRFKSKKRVPI